MAQSVGGREPLRETLLLVRLTESELYVQLEQAAEDLEKLLLDRRIPTLRDAQYRIALAEIRNQMRDLWRGPIADTIEAGKRRAATAAADVAFGILGNYANLDGVEVFSRESFRMTAREGIKSLVSRSSNNVTLAERVYKNGVEAGSAIDRIVNSGLAAGKSAREIAKEARSHINPDTPGGSSYAAMRLGRTEINNAYHTSTVKVMAANPFVESMKWNLSGSHPRPDACDGLAQKGPYPKDRVPSKPHPQCFCFLTPEVEDEDDFIKNFKSGKYDAYLNAKLDGEEDYAASEREQKAAIGQRRVLLQDGKQYAMVDLSPQRRARFLTPEERRLMNEKQQPKKTAATGISGEQKIRNAEIMFGTNSPQHKAAIKRFSK